VFSLDILSHRMSEMAIFRQLSRESSKLANLSLLLIGQILFPEHEDRGLATKHENAVVLTFVLHLSPRHLPTTRITADRKAMVIQIGMIFFPTSPDSG